MVLDEYNESLNKLKAIITTNNRLDKIEEIADNLQKRNKKFIEDMTIMVKEEIEYHAKIASELTKMSWLQV